MKKNLDILRNDYCPQALFLFGTYKDDGSPNFGLFCWFSYCWDGELCVMTCIGGDKLTKDMIHKNRVFSANLVTEELLPVADYLGNTDGYDAKKMNISLDIDKGNILDVPVMEKSPWVYELEVKNSLPMDDGELFLCRIRNIIVDEGLASDYTSPLPIEKIKPVFTTGQTYFTAGAPIAMWGDYKNL